MHLKVFAQISILGVLIVSTFQNCSPVMVTDQEQASVKGQGVTPPPAPICQKVTSPDVQPELQYSWDYATGVEPEFKQVMAAPSVGDIDGDKIPEIAFTSYQGGAYKVDGVLRVLNGKDGAIKFSITDPDLRPLATTTPLLIDIDADGKGEIIYIHYEGKKVIALNSNGSLRWKLDFDFTGLVDQWSNAVSDLKGCRQGFAAADLNGDGRSEIIAAGFIIQEDGNHVPSIQKRFSASDCSSFAASLDAKENSVLRILDNSSVYDRQGNPLWSYKHTGQAATADLIPELPGIEVVVSGGGFLSIYNGLTGEVVLDKALSEHSELICENGQGQKVIGGGQATIGDFDGDPKNLEIAVATGRSLTIFNKKGEILAGSVTRDCSSLQTGVTSFDFNGDGKPEIIYGDEQYLRIYEMDGTKDLKAIWSLINPTGTLFEYPVVADVDGSGEAKLVTVANNMWVNNNGWYSTDEERTEALKITGLRVFGPKVKKAWMPTRAVWNQYSYFVSNIRDNLQATPTSVLNGFVGNAFKRNVQAGMFQEVCRNE